MDLKNKTTEKLQKEIKDLKVITGALVGVLSVLFIAIIIGLLTKENNKTFIALIAVPIALGAIIPLNYSNIKKMQKELASREQQ